MPNSFYPRITTALAAQLADIAQCLDHRLLQQSPQFLFELSEHAEAMLQFVFATICIYVAL